ncbi:MAG: SCP2 sterol-binding domain-containing protein, partial [Thermoleophilaceae bacterium]
VGSDAGLRVVFKGMEQAFEPERAAGFEGAVQYELMTTRGVRRWSVRIDGDRAVASPGRVDDPAVTIKTSVPVFMRVAAREINAGKAVLDGDLVVDGDFQTAARLGEMFGQASPW